VLLVTHDWGAYLGYLFAARHPSRLRRMVAMDIGANPAAHGIKQVLLTVAYQWHLVGSWLLGGILPSLGRLHAQGMARLMGVSRERRARLKSRFCYPYWVLWTDLVLPWRRKNLQRGYRPRCPVLFLYGDRKALMFHSERWLVVRLTTRARDHSVMRRRQQSQ